MRFSAGKIANAIAWAVLVGLLPFIFVMVRILGPFALVILGVAVLFICTSLDLNDDVPNASGGVLRSRFVTQPSPEQRAATLEEKRVRLSPLGFYRWCGVALLVAGLAGFALERWQD
jgi:hypothetical protein